MPQFWSWLLAGGGLLVYWLAGNHNRWTWHVGLVSQAAWFTYGLVSWQFGFMASAVAFAMVSWRNLLKRNVDTQGGSG